MGPRAGNPRPFRVRQVPSRRPACPFLISRIQYSTSFDIGYSRLGVSPLSQRLSMVSRLPQAPRFPRLVLLGSVSLAAAVPVAPAQDIFVTPIANAPFTAVVQVERSSVRPDALFRPRKLSGRLPGPRPHLQRGAHADSGLEQGDAASSQHSPV